jgi:hypothetical protein
MSIDEVAGSEFYPNVSEHDLLSRDGFDRMLGLMRETHSHWLARVPIEGREQDRAEEVAELAVDLSLVALQLAAPAFGTRTMSRLDARRGASEKRTLSEVDGSYRAGWTRMEPGLSIGSGLATIAQCEAVRAKASQSANRREWSTRTARIGGHQAEAHQRRAP